MQSYTLLQLKNILDDYQQSNRIKVGQFVTKTRTQTEQYLQLIQQLIFQIQENKQLNIRSFYYQNKQLFNNQGQSDQVIKNICKHLNCDRESLNLQSTSRGLVYGQLQILFQDTQVTSLENQQMQITNEVNQIKSIQTGANYIILVEKDTIFQYLIQQTHLLEYNVILLTGKGNPDFYTKKFLNLIMKQTQLSVFALCDFNYYGHQILYNYFDYIESQYKQNFFVIGMFQPVQTSDKIMRQVSSILKLQAKLQFNNQLNWKKQLSSLLVKNQMEDEIDSMIKYDVLMSYIEQRVDETRELDYQQQVQYQNNQSDLFQISIFD